MNIPISEHSLSIEAGDIYVVDSEMDDGTLNLHFIQYPSTYEIHLTIDQMQRLRNLLTAAIKDAFEVQPEIACPACGITWAEVDAQQDTGSVEHRNCRRYPFFPHEYWRSFAK